MSTQNIFTALCGNEVQSWAVGFDKLPQSFWVRDYSMTLGQAAWPVLRFDQIPPQWLASDPGFFILLRDRSKSIPDKNWLIGSSDYEFTSTPKVRPIKRVICIVHHDPLSVEVEFNRIQSLHPSAEVLWTQYACTAVPPLPRAQYIDFHVLLQQMNFVPDAVYDFNYFTEDTYSPAHIFCFHQGAILMNNSVHAEQPRTLRTKKSLWYGDWIIFEPVL